MADELGFGRPFRGGARRERDVDLRLDVDAGFLHRLSYHLPPFARFGGLLVQSRTGNAQLGSSCAPATLATVG
jgi:hypothetical protein